MYIINLLIIIIISFEFILTKNSYIIFAVFVAVTHNQ